MVVEQQPQRARMCGFGDKVGAPAALSSTCCQRCLKLTVKVGSETTDSPTSN